MKQIVINLLGGAGSGKSTIALELATSLKKMGVNCEYINEFAKQKVYKKNQMAIDDQLYLLANQEYNMRITRGDVQVLICDSPLYFSPFYNMRLLENGKETVSQEAIIAVVKDCAKFFDNMNYFIWRNHPYVKLGRYQTEEEADKDAHDMHRLLKDMEVDMQELKSTDPCMQIITCDLMEKLRKVEKESKKQNSAEIERKFLVKEMPKDIKKCKKHEVIQGYLRTGDVEERVRSIDDNKFVHTIKAGSGLERKEYEQNIDKVVFDELLKQTVGSLILKTRHVYSLGSAKNAEIDIYKSPVNGLKTVEVEFASVKEAKAFEVPAWFGEEITEDKRYKNQALAMGSLDEESDIIV